VQGEYGNNGRNEAICKSPRRIILVFNHRLNIE
jgi:hypothetical protein